MSDYCVVRDGYIPFRKKRSYLGKRFRKLTAEEESGEGWKLLLHWILPLMLGGYIVLFLGSMYLNYLVKFLDWVAFMVVYGMVAVLLVLSVGVERGWIHPRMHGFHSMLK